jgi:hypothetical protein
MNYQWQFNGVTMASGSANNILTNNYAPTLDGGTNSFIVTNPASSVSVNWTNVFIANPGMVENWGANGLGQCNRPASLTNVEGIAAGEYQSIAATDSGSVVQWGAYDSAAGITFSVTNFAASSSPPTSNVVAVAAGQVQGLALLANGTVYSWGMLTNGFGWNATSQPSLTGITAIACGYAFDMALSNGTVIAWGDTNFGETNVPSYLTNVAAIAASGYHGMALESNGTVVTWGTVPSSLTNPPPLTNPVAIATGYSHFLALQSNGMIVAWGDNALGQCTVPSAACQNNVMAIAAGDYFSMALLNTGTVVVWGDGSSGQTNLPQFNTNYPLNFKLIAAGGDHAMAAIWSPLVQYPVNVARDLLLIYNTNSLDSSNVCQYYLAHRPMVSGANVLAIGCQSNNETISPSDYTNIFAYQVQTWLTNNPTKRPQYVVLFQDIPTRVNSGGFGATNTWPSVQYQLHNWCSPAWYPFVMAINMNSTNEVTDCEAYINKLQSMGSNLPGRLFLSGTAAGIGNNNYYFDDSRFTNYLYYPNLGFNAESGVLAASPSAFIMYTNVIPDSTLANHLTNGSNLAGYLCWGWHSELGLDYAINDTVTWTGNSGWWIIRTAESFNGDRNGGGFISWFASNAFGGSNYANTPIGAVSYVDEPGVAATFDQIYFGLWESGEPFALCAWNSNDSLYPQYVGDPFVSK